MFQLCAKVVIVDDFFEQNLPIGEYGYVIAYDRNNDSAFDYIIRIPNQNIQIYVPARDIELESSLVIQEVERIQKEALIDFALKTYNQPLFHKVMNGEQEPQIVDANPNSQTSEEFIRQVNLKAWI